MWIKQRCIECWQKEILQLNTISTVPTNFDVDAGRGAEIEVLMRNKCGCAQTALLQARRP
jgi:hypothetical protein